MKLYCIPILKPCL